jgi:hypothetical protein
MGGGIINSVAVAVDNVTLELNAGLLKIKDAGVNLTQLAASVQPNWKYIETLTFTNEPTKTTAAMTAYKYYRVLGKARATSNTNTPVLLQLNGDGGNNYETFFWDNLTPTTISATNGVTMFSCFAVSQFFGGEAFIIGKAPANNPSHIGIYSNTNGVISAGYVVGIHANWKAGNETQVSTITITANATNIYGEFQIFGSD